MPKKCLWLLLFFLSFKIFASPGQDVRYQSFGGAYRANPSSANGIMLYNPAGLLQKRRFELDFDYELNSYSKNSNLTFSASDSKTSEIAMGLLYSLLPDEKPFLASAHTCYLSAAFPIIEHLFSIGFSGHYKNSQRKNFFNMDMGILVNSNIGFLFALTGNNLLVTQYSLEPTSGALGLAFDFSRLASVVPLTLSLDWIMNDLLSDESLNHEVNMGAEYVIFGMLPIRSGLNNQVFNHQKNLSIGSGLLTEFFSLDVFYKQNLLVGKQKEFGLGLRFMLQ